MKNFIQKHKTLLTIILLVVICFGLYINILPNPWIWSEQAVVVNNPTFKDLSYLPKFFTKRYWLKEHPFSGTNLFRPMRAVTFTLEYALFGLDPKPAHITNIALHAATTVMVFLIFKKIAKSFWVGAFTALLFAVHPGHTETIDWTMSRDDLMCTLFPLVAWWFFLKRTTDTNRRKLEPNQREQSSRHSGPDHTVIPDSDPESDGSANSNSRQILNRPPSPRGFGASGVQNDDLRVQDDDDNSRGLAHQISVNWRRLKTRVPQVQVRNTVYLLLEMLFFALGLLAREMAVVFPLLLVFYVLCFLPKEDWKRGLLATIPYWLLNIAYAFYHFFYFWEGLTGPQGRLNPDIVPPLKNHILLVGKTIGFYVKLLAWPFQLSADHYFPLEVSWAGPATRGYFILGVLTLVIAAYLFFKKRRKWAFGMLFATLGFAPVANIILVTGRPIGEQRLYLPSIGFCFLLGLGFAKIAEAKINFKYFTLGSLFLPLMLAYSYKTYDRNLDWRSPLALWESSVKVSPKTLRAHRNLSGAYIANGLEDEAIQTFETILDLEAEQRAQYGVQTVYKQSGLPMGALSVPILPLDDERKICELREEMEKEAREKMIHPDAELHYFLAEAYRKRKGDLKRAAFEYNMAIVYDPSNYEAYNGLGITYDMAGFSVAGEYILEKGTKIHPDFHPLWHNLGLTYEHQDKWEEAVEAYEKVIELAPIYDQPHLRLTIIYAKYHKNEEKARKHWNEYLRLTRYPDPVYLEEFKHLEERD